MRTFAEFLKSYMEEKDLSVQEISDVLGLSRSTVYSWISDAAQPRLNDFLDICKKFQVSPNEVFDYQTTSNTKQPTLDVVQKGFRKLNDDGQLKVLTYIVDIYDKYKKKG